MKLKLTDPEINSLLPSIRSVLETGAPWEDESLHHPAGAIIAAVLTIEGVEKDDSNEDSSQGFMTNGWEYDWWQDFKYDGKKYVLSGSGHLGGHRFHLNDEQ